jgi:polyhydroxyalkanoate synthesis regulator protein
MTRRIIKYSNRRLYDAAQGRSITLLELSDLVASGETVTVELKGTGEDITAVTLLQSILERLRRRPRGFLGSGVADRLLSSVRRAMDERAGPDEIETGLTSGDAAMSLPD